MNKKEEKDKKLDGNLEQGTLVDRGCKCYDGVYIH